MPLLAPTRISLGNILIATDFSPSSAAVVPYARSLAKQYKSTLFLAHVISTEVLGVDPTQMDDARSRAAQQMKEFEASAQLEGIAHKLLMEEGPTWDALLRMIEENQIDLVIAGTHGRTGAGKFVLGSVAEDIFRHAPCPVLTIGPKVVPAEKGEAKFGRILYATDFASEAPAAVIYAASLAQEHKAELTLLHVAEADSRMPVPQRLLALLPKETELMHPPEAVIEIGDPAERILRVAAMRRADLIVLGAHRPAILTTHMMDVAYKVVIEAPCPVLTVAPTARL